MKKVYKAWCEYDVGVEDIIYETEELALSSLKEAVERQGLDWGDLVYDELVQVEAVEYKVV